MTRAEVWPSLVKFFVEHKPDIFFKEQYFHKKKDIFSIGITWYYYLLTNQDHILFKLIEFCFVNIRSKYIMSSMKMYYVSVYYDSNA